MGRHAAQGSRHAAAPPSWRKRISSWAIVLSVSLTASLVSLFPATANHDPSLISFNDAICDLGTAGYLGSGISADPWQISDSESLWEVTDCEAQNPGGHYQLISNIYPSLASAAPTNLPIGAASSNQTHLFEGHLNGAGFQISGLSISATIQNGLLSVGLFAGLRNAEIRNLSISGSIRGAEHPLYSSDDLRYSTGAIAGRSDGTLTLSNITVDATILGSRRVGGMVGAVQDVIASQLAMAGAISGTTNTAGFFGAVSGQAVIMGSRNDANLVGVGVEAVGTFGGFIAGAEYAEVIDSTNHGDVIGGYITAGIVGGARGVTFSNVVNTGKITAGRQSAPLGITMTGGLVGVVGTASISRSKNFGPVVVWGSVAGGLVGRGEDVKIQESVNSGEVVAALNSVGGLVGYAGTVEVLDSINRATISAVSGIAGLVGRIETSGRFERVVSAGNLEFLRGPTSSALLGQLGTLAVINPSANTGLDGISLGVGMGSITASDAYSNTSSRRVTISGVVPPSNPDLLDDWNLNSIWGFDCAKPNPTPELRILAGSQLNASCYLSPPPAASGGNTNPNPTPNIFGSYSATVGQDFEVRGTSFSSIRAVHAGNVPLVIKVLSDSFAVLSVPAGTIPGRYTLSIQVASGEISSTASLEVIATSPETFSPTVSKTMVVRSFSQARSMLNDAQIRQVQNFIARFQDREFVCTAVTHSSLRLRQIIGIKRQAQEVCSLVSSTLTANQVRVQLKPTLQVRMVQRILVTAVSPGTVAAR